MRTCTIEGCTRALKARGWCATHWAAWRKYGDPEHCDRMKARPCSVDGCDERWEIKGFCKVHYKRWLRTGSTEIKWRNNLPIEARLDAQTQVDEASGCWLWTGRITSKGYGQMSVKRKTFFVHRLSYERHVGPIPPELTIDHLCCVKNCVNPEHLEAVPPGVNSVRGFAMAAVNRRKTHCPQGHAYDEENTYQGKRGRSCRTCARERYHRHKHRYDRTQNSEAA